MFKTAEEYTVLHEGRVLGKMEAAYDVGDHLLFAGRRWQIIGVEDERLELHVVPARGKKPPRFGGSVGDIHPRVREKMRDILNESIAYDYLNTEAGALLKEARSIAHETGIFQSAVLALGSRKSALFTWTGTRIQRTVEAAFAAAGTRPCDESIALTFDNDEVWLQQRAREAIVRCESAYELARFVSDRRRRKYDWLLDDPLLDASIARGALDVERAAAILQQAV